MKTGFGPALVVAAGIALAGWFGGHGLVKGRTVDRYVTVKGVAEREVQADVAFWPLRYVATHDVLTTAQAEIDRSRRTILEFLAGHGIPNEAVEVNFLEVQDKLANAYGSRDASGGRYIITQTLMVSTEDVAAVKAASQALGDLVNAGVVLGGTYGGPSYRFRGLNELKPGMIGEATASAREAAEKFAQDSGARVGGIRRANQGVFQILARDQAPGIVEENQLSKVVRVVSTVEYFLE
jgi:hypothetical protein